jgi:hypothetical protein
MHLVVKILFGSFFAFCIGIHVYGLIIPFYTETVLSHVIHILSYTLCLYTVLKNVNHRLLLFILGAVYPFLFHASCAWNTFSTHHTLNTVCLLVVFLLPLAGIWLWFLVARFTKE